MIKSTPKHDERSQTSVPEECQWTPCPRPDIELTFDEFLAMPHRLGWKHEYWDGMARLSPNMAAITEFVLDVRAWSRSRTKPPGSSTPINIDRVQASDRSDLEQLHQSAFVDGIEYVGYSPTAYAKEVARSIDRYFPYAPRRLGTRRSTFHRSTLLCGSSWSTNCRCDPADCRPRR